MEIDEMKDALIGEMKRDKAYTVQGLCKLLGTSDDFSVMMSISELEDERRVKGHESLQIYREDGGAILLARYEVV